MTDVATSTIINPELGVAFQTPAFTSLCLEFALELTIYFCMAVRAENVEYCNNCVGTLAIYYLFLMVPVRELPPTSE
jgi:hypothetical protein